MVPFCRYRFIAEVITPLSLPEFAGFRVRGALGLALKHLACRRGEPVERQECGGCSLRFDCGYGALFEPSVLHDKGQGSVFVPYVVEAHAEGDFQPGQRISFDILLIGSAGEYLPLLTDAIMRMLDHGLGPEKGKAQLKQIRLPDLPGAPVVFDRRQQTFTAHESLMPDVNPNWQSERVELELTTPLRIEVKGKLLKPGQLDATVFVETLLRRIERLGAYYVPGWQSPDLSEVYAVLPELYLVEENIRLKELDRFSHRQSKKMKMDGLMGRLVLEGKLKPLLPWLITAEHLHIGKNTVFGLGRYRIDVI